MLQCSSVRLLDMLPAHFKCRSFPNNNCARLQIALEDGRKGKQQYPAKPNHVFFAVKAVGAYTYLALAPAILAGLTDYKVFKCITTKTLTQLNYGNCIMVQNSKSLHSILKRKLAEF